MDVTLQKRDRQNADPAQSVLCKKLPVSYREYKLVLLTALAIFGQRNNLVPWPNTASNPRVRRYSKMMTTKQTNLRRTSSGENYFYTTVKSPLGALLLIAHASALTGLYFTARNPKRGDRWTLDARHPVLALAAVQVQEYFAGKRHTFSVPLRPLGTPFQENIWSEIARIPYGEILSYSTLAKRAGAPRAIRAAGTATGQNPISIIIPCHRVMGKNGGLCGFAGGLELKRRLLALESPVPFPSAALTLFHAAAKSGHEKS